MKKIVLVSFVFFSIQVNAQSIIDSIGKPGFSLQDSTGEKLADIALKNNPNILVLDKQIEADMYTWKKDKMSFFNNISASFNLNERNLPSRRKNKDSLFSNIYYPRYNINFTLPLNSIFARPMDSKISKATYEGSILSKDVAIRTLKEKIKNDYLAYKANIYYLQLQEIILHDEAVLLSQVQQKFETNEASLETFANASKRYNQEIAKKLNLVQEVTASKIALEASIGMNLETALTIIKSKK